MAKSTSILLGDYFDKFIDEEISSGKYSSESEVIKTALRLLEQEEQKIKQLQAELALGEESQMTEDFNSENKLREIHSKHL